MKTRILRIGAENELWMYQACTWWPSTKTCALALVGQALEFSSLPRGVPPSIRRYKLALNDTPVTTMVRACATVAESER